MSAPKDEQPEGDADVATDILMAKTDPAAEYLAGVAAALSDLPAAELAEIMDDVRAHLADLAAEFGAGAGTAAFTERLGSPAAYAAELRAAAGYPSAPVTPTAVAPRPGPVAAGFSVALLVVATVCLLLAVAGRSATFPFALLAPLAAIVGVVLVFRDGPRVPSVAALAVVRAVLTARPAEGQQARAVFDFVASLQPAWWVLRALTAAVLVTAVLGSWILLPLVAVVAVPVSIWLSHRSRRDRRWLWLVIPLNGLAVAVVLMLPTVPFRVLGAPQVSSPSSSMYQRGLWQDGSREIRDLLPFDAAGNPLTGVYLFDQDGRPVDTLSGCAARYSARPTAQAQPYPRGVAEYDRNGACLLVPPGPLVVAIPKATATPAPGPSSLPSAAATTPAAPTTPPR